MPGRIELSVVIPVFNGAATIERVVSELLQRFDIFPIEIVLVNDGSSDTSEQILATLADQYPQTVVHVQLSRNFGEHAAVLAGLALSRGDCVGIIDDDGQHPPEQLLRLWKHQQSTQADVVYGCYRIKQHAAWRNLGSRFHGWTARWLLAKPRHIYISSFKVLSRFVVDQIASTTGPFPHLDGLILRTTDRLAQLEVEHAASGGPSSRYNLRRLVGLWWNLCVGYSLVPLQLSMLVGLAAFIAAIALPASCLLIGTVESLIGAGTVFIGLSGLECLCLSIIGDYIGRFALQANGCKPYIVRYVRRGEPHHA
jgi:glycosyltransferase involved in cell wall biosynthesis